MSVEVSLNDYFFEMVISGKKTVDSRVYKPPYDQIKAGNIIKFVGAQTKELHTLCKVINVSVYKSFDGMLRSEGIQNCLPGIKNIEEAIATYHSFPNYKDGEEKYGVVAFQVQRI